MEKGVLGNKTGRGFFWKEGKVRHVLDAVSGDYRPESELRLPDLSYIADVASLYAQARYAEGIQVFLNAEGDEAALARKVVAGYISYAFSRVGEVTDTIDEIDRIMGAGFNWGPPSVLVATSGPPSGGRLTGGACLAVPEAIAPPGRPGEPKRFFSDRRVNTGKFFVAS